MSYVHTTGESPGYLFGVPFVGAPPWFWFGSFLLKMTTISLVVIVAGLVSWRWLARSVVRRALVVLGPMMVGLVTMMAFAQRPFGVRYLIPLIVIALVASGTLATVVSWRIALATLAIVLIAQSGVLWASHPYSLAWSNPLFGQSWRLAADSNVDWGQDFYRLQAWAEGKDTVYVSYYGFGPSLELTEIPNAVPGLNVTGLLLGLDAGFNEPPAEGEYVAISASALNLVKDQFGLLHSVCPVDEDWCNHLGVSISNKCPTRSLHPTALRGTTLASPRPYVRTRPTALTWAGQRWDRCLAGIESTA